VIAALELALGAGGRGFESHHLHSAGLAAKVGRDRGVRIVHVEECHPAERADLGPGDLTVTVAGEPVVDAETLPRRMFGEAFDVPLPLTTLRNGAKVDVIAQPVEQRDDADR
jgi:S1-C subfamily serine protease